MQCVLPRIFFLLLVQSPVKPCFFSAQHVHKPVDFSVHLPASTLNCRGDPWFGGALHLKSLTQCQHLSVLFAVLAWLNHCSIVCKLSFFIIKKKKEPHTTFGERWLYLRRITTFRFTFWKAIHTYLGQTKSLDLKPEVSHSTFFMGGHVNSSRVLPWHICQLLGRVTI